jgi:hypothetical protein
VGETAGAGANIAPGKKNILAGGERGGIDLDGSRCSQSKKNGDNFTVGVLPLYDITK